jgi:hypothetical protein
MLNHSLHLVIDQPILLLPALAGLIAILPAEKETQF